MNWSPMVFFPKVALPTRIEDSSSSLIDNIFTNDTEVKEIAEILLNRLSGHQIMFTSRAISTVKISNEVMSNHCLI